MCCRHILPFYGLKKIVPSTKNVNKLYISIWWSAIKFNILQVFNILRFTIGPLPSAFCFGLFVLRKALIVQCFVFLSAISVSRYMMIFWMKNPTGLEENFWSIFINSWTIIFSIILSIIRANVPGNQQLEYYVCLGVGHMPKKS
jgi:hypothetical protein